jgi:hypothetical protein
MKVWIARDKDGELYAYENKPQLSNSGTCFIYSIPASDFFEIPKKDPIGKGVTFENSPQKIELVKRVN